MSVAMDGTDSNRHALSAQFKALMRGFVFPDPYPLYLLGESLAKNVFMEDSGNRA